MTTVAHIRRSANALRRDRRGVAAIEFALSLPLVLSVVLAGLELTNFTVTKLRTSQLALHIADNASRIGTRNLTSDPRISETQINDILTGAAMQAGMLDIFQRGRVIISSVEPDTANTGKVMIHWQRCRGIKNWPSSYGTEGQSNMAGVGPANRQVVAPAGTGIMYVEIAYDYKPLVGAKFVTFPLIKEVAAMTVRDKRDFNGNGGKGIYNNESATASACSAFNSG